MVQSPITLRFNPLFEIDLLSPLRNFFNWLVSQMVSLGNSLIKTINYNVIKPIMDSLGWISEQVKNLIETVVSNIINFVISVTRPADPERVFSTMLKLLVIAGLGYLSINLLLTALGVKIAGTGISVTPLSNFINRFIRPDLIISLGIGTILGIFLRIPLGYWAKKTFRPYKPEPFTLFQLYTRGYITREQLKSELAYVTGYSDNYIEGLIDIFEYNPSLFELIRMADYVELSEDFIRKSLKILGVKEPYYSIIFSMIKRRPIREEIRANVNFLVYAYQNGYISKDFLSLALDNLGLQSMEKQLIMMLADNKRTFELIERKIKILRTSFIKGFISEATLISELEKLRLDREFINIIVADAKLYAKVELPVPKITRGYTTEIIFTTSYSYSIS